MTERGSGQPGPLFSFRLSRSRGTGGARNLLPQGRQIARSFVCPPPEPAAAFSRAATVRPVNGIAENVKLNQALFTLAEEMAQIKRAA